jgi:hypothetical protein
MHDCLGPGGEGYELVVHGWFTLIKEGENVITRKVPDHYWPMLEKRGDETLLLTGVPPVAKNLRFI